LAALEGRAEDQAAGEKELKTDSSHPARWERGRERVIAATPIFELRGVSYRHPARKTEREFVSLASADWVNVIAVTPDDCLVLVRQFRYGVDDFSLEIPGGVINAGEDPVAAGRRELAEETGYAGGRARLLGGVYPNPAIQNNRCHLVLVEGVEPNGTVQWDQDEEIAVITAGFEETMDWARQGRISHALVICGLFYYEQWRRGKIDLPSGGT
jgi:8-oxo-dGTP pyrophosphatase MutT (NUDIX family)